MHSISGQAPNTMCPIRTNRSRYIGIRTNRLRYVGCFDSFFSFADNSRTVSARNKIRSPAAPLELNQPPGNRFRAKKLF